MTSHPEPLKRDQIRSAQRIVIKIGSSSMTRADGGLNLNRMDEIATLVAARAKNGQEVVLVSSGAIAAGITPLEMSSRPRDLATIQATAALGQGILLARWSAAFQAHHLHVAQVLLTASDVMRRVRYTNARQTLNRLLTLGIVPVVNENDAVANAEMTLGDNDRLAALVSHLVQADVLLLLTDVDSLYDAPPSEAGAQRIREIGSMKDLNGVIVGGRGSVVGTGGMRTKVEAAEMAAASGIPVLLAGADQVSEALSGADTGTWFAATGPRRKSRRLWLSYAAQPLGRLHLDAGATRAVTIGKRSLLAAGVIGVDGDFGTGDVIEIIGPDGIVARGTSSYSAEEIRKMVGKSTSQIRSDLDFDARPVVHRDDLAELPSGLR